MPAQKLKLFIPWATAVILTDWLSKMWAHQLYGGYQTLIPGVIRIHLVQNEGGALDVFFAQPMIAQLVWHGLTLLGCSVLAIWIWRTQTLPRFGIAALSILFGALFANGVERILRGQVTDFIETPFTPIINFADLWAIFATILVWLALFMQPENVEAKES